MTTHLYLLQGNFECKGVPSIFEIGIAATITAYMLHEEMEDVEVTLTGRRASYTALLQQP